MPSLAETQATFRRALLPGGSRAAIDLVTAPSDVRLRLAIYQRHHRESLGRHMRGRFPTVEWLIGTARMDALAAGFTSGKPPAAPCLAEYGVEFADTLATSDLGRALPYARDVALLDWHLGSVAVAADEASLPISSLAALPDEQLPELTLRLQAGVRYLGSGWPVDRLVSLRLGESEPDTLEFRPEPVSLEIRGSRGVFRITRLEAPLFRFRAAIAAGSTLGAAFEQAAAASPDFDVSPALAGLFAEGLVAGLPHSTQETFR